MKAKNQTKNGAGKKKKPPIKSTSKESKGQEEMETVDVELIKKSDSGEDKKKPGKPKRLVSEINHAVERLNSIDEVRDVDEEVIRKKVAKKKKDNLKKDNLEEDAPVEKGRRMSMIETDKVKRKSIADIAAQSAANPSKTEIKGAVDTYFLDSGFSSISMDKPADAGEEITEKKPSKRFSDKVFEITSKPMAMIQKLAITLCGLNCVVYLVTMIFPIAIKSDKLPVFVSLTSVFFCLITAALIRIIYKHKTGRKKLNRAYYLQEMCTLLLIGHEMVTVILWKFLFTFNSMKQNRGQFTFMFCRLLIITATCIVSYRLTRRREHILFYGNITLCTVLLMMLELIWYMNNGVEVKS